MGACQQPEKNQPIQGAQIGKIIYETAIVNPDSTDSWANECLADFNRKMLIDNVFKAVYDGKITPVDYFTGTNIPPDQIRKMENDGEFSREHIRKIQFEERWIWDNGKVEMQKQLISMTIAYEVFDQAGKSRGQKPIFRLVFRK